jgi:antitoxin component of RelBE/YafQ-DinJ toxin-antitoxin module
MAKQLRIYLRAEGEIVERFQQVKEHMGLKNDSDVMRALINWYWKEHQKRARG